MVIKCIYSRLWKKIPLSRCSNTAWDNTQRYEDSHMASTQNSHVLVLFPKSVLFMHCLYIIQAQQCSLSARGHYVGPCLIAAHMLYEMHYSIGQLFWIFSTFTFFRFMDVLEWVSCVDTFTGILHDSTLFDASIQFTDEANSNIRGFHLWCEAPMRPKLP